MNRSTTAVAAVTLLAAAACTGALPSAAPVVAVTSGDGRAAPPPSHQMLVWTKDAQGKTETFTLNEQGAVLSRHDGVRIAVRGEVWAWRETKSEVPMTGCPEYDDQGNQVGIRAATDAGTVVGATLERLTDDGVEREGTSPWETKEIVAPASHADLADLAQNVELVATVGPYLFVKESTYVYGCGAHGTTGFSSVMWDAERGAAMWASEEEKTTQLLGGEAATLRGRAAAALPGDDAFRDKDGGYPLELTEIVPAFAPDASLTVSARFTGGACYACSDGEWSSYSVSTLQPMAAPPAPLASWTKPPAAVSAFARAHTAVLVGGYSELTR